MMEENMNQSMAQEQLWGHIPLNEKETGITSFRARDDETITELNIPAELDGYRVTRIAPRVMLACGALKSLTLPEGLVEIGEMAFCGCTSLECVVLPGSLRRIGYGAFAHCHRLKKIELPEKIESIGSCGFFCCMALEGDIGI